MANRFSVIVTAFKQRLGYVPEEPHLYTRILAGLNTW